MSNSEGSAAPASGSNDAIPSFDELAADPEIAALLDFEPVPRKIEMPGGWTPAGTAGWASWRTAPTKKAELRRQLNKWRVSQGLEPIGEREEGGEE